MEIARRFALSIDTTENMRQLAKAIFEARTIVLDWEGGTKIASPVYDPCYLLAIKESLAKNHIPYDTGNNGNLIKLTTANFIAVFARSGYGKIKTQINGVITTHKEYEKSYQELFDDGVPLSSKLKSFLQNNWADILGAIPVVKEIMPAATVIAKAVGAGKRT